MAASRAGAVRRVPERTCVGCRTARAKRELVRLVRRPDGTVVLDPTGRLAGRGAYLCHGAACAAAAIRRRALEHALGVSPGSGIAEAVVAGLPDLGTAVDHQQSIPAEREPGRRPERAAGRTRGDVHGQE